LVQGHYFTQCPEELVELLTQSSPELKDEIESRQEGPSEKSELIQKMVEIHHDGMDWEQKERYVENTSESVRKLVRSIVETRDRIGDEELTAVYILCTHPKSFGIDPKRERVRSLSIPEEDVKDIVSHLNEETGTVMAGKTAIEVPHEHEKEVYEFLKTAIQKDATREKIDGAIERLASSAISGVQSGIISAILYFLQPTEYPIVNSRSIYGMEEVFDEDVSQQLSDYVEEAKKYREVNEKYDFYDNYRDLDLFLCNVEENEYEKRAREALNGDPEKTYWTWNTNYDNEGTDGSECFRRGIAATYGPDKYGEKLSKVQKGDTIIAYCDEVGYRGVGVVTGETDGEPVDEDNEDKIRESVKEYHVDVDWVYTLPKGEAISAKEGAEILYDGGPLQVSTLQKFDQEGSKRLREEIRQRYIELNKIDREEEIERQLRDKKQAVFYGPPGTSKTYAATKLADWWRAKEDKNAIGKGQVRSVTFHPSFAYEDFLEGFTSEVKGNQVEYSYEDGALLKIVEDATEAYERSEDGETPPFFLIIDEINRGELAQIFGETITLLEEDKRLGERNQMSTELAHSGREFSIPPNLYVIGTMNTADESIALIDTALRRRFRLIPFPPETERVVEYYGLGNEDLAQLARNGSGFEQLLSVSVLALDEINNRILSEPHLGKGKQIGHTYLLELSSEQELIDTWRFEILPQLEKHYFGQFENLHKDLFHDLESDNINIIDTDNRRIAEFDRGELYEDLRTIVPDEDIEVQETEEGENAES
jgi:MoxR-like ATPase